MLLIAALIIAVVVILSVLSPFFLGEGGALASAAAENSPEVVRRVKEAIVRRYLAEEQAFEANQIPRRSWEARKRFLQNRYLDAARRLDFLSYMEKMEKAGR